MMRWILAVLLASLIVFGACAAPSPSPTPTPTPPPAPAPTPVPPSAPSLPSEEAEPKMVIEELSKEFYDSQIFHAVIAGTDVWSGFLETVFKSVSEADPSFAAIDSNLFWQEMTAVRMEVFALAWRDKFEHDKYTIPQSIFTRRYLEENGRLDIWEIMGEYNLAIAQSAHITESGEPIDERSWTHINKLRTDMFVKWAEANIGDPNSMTKEDEENANCVARVGNRIGADIRRADTIAVKLLASRLADRLGADINLRTEALFRLAATIFGFYEGAKEYLRSVTLQ